MSEAAEDGHCSLPQPELIESVIKLLTNEEHQPTEEAIALTIKDMALKDELIREKNPDQTLLCYKPTYFHTEQNLAQLISGRLSQPIAQDIPLGDTRVSVLEYVVADKTVRTLFLPRWFLSN